MRVHQAGRAASVFLLGSFGLSLLQSSAAGQGPAAIDVGMSAERLQRIGRMIDRRIAAKDIAGAVTFVARKGRIVHFEARGVMDLESKQPMTKDAIFQIQSMTKPITTTAILMLAEEGRLHLDDPIARFIPEYAALNVVAPDANAASTAPVRTVPAARQITIRDVLTHTAGMVAGPDSVSARELAKAPRRPTETLAGFIPRVAAVPLEFQPGTRWLYSPGIGFATLGHVVEVVSGETLDRFLRARIFEPLRMTDTVFNVTESQTPRFATRYTPTAAGLEKLPPLAATVFFSGSGGLMSTTGDYARFTQMLLNGGELDGKRLLSPRSVERLSAVYIPSTLPGRTPGQGYGLGVRVITDASAANTWLSNGSYGWQGGGGTCFFVDPKEQLVAVAMTHTANACGLASGLLRDFEQVVVQAIVAN